MQFSVVILEKTKQTSKIFDSRGRSKDILSNKNYKPLFNCRLLTVTENDRKVPLYSISGNPLLSHEFCVSGRDEYVRIYDTRKLSRTNEEGEEKPTPLKRFCPHHLQGHQSKPHITAAVYNYDGTEIIASYNDENIYMFDTSHSDMADYIKSFEGHLNSATGKSVNNNPQQKSCHLLFQLLICCFLNLQ